MIDSDSLSCVTKEFVELSETRNDLSNGPEASVPHGVARKRNGSRTPPQNSRCRGGWFLPLVKRPLDRWLIGRSFGLDRL